MSDKCEYCVYKHTRRKKREFSKSLMAAVMITYFIGVIVGTWAVVTVILGLKELYDQSIIIGVLTAYFGLLAAPVGVAIGFYGWKSKSENVIKIANTQSTDTMDKISQLGGLPTQ